MPKIGSKAVSTPSPSSQEKVAGKEVKGNHTIVWQMRSISVEMHINRVDTKEKIVARCCGGIGVHRSLMKYEVTPTWVVSSTTVGLMLCQVLLETDALRIATVLLERCPKPFTLLTADTIRNALPPWVEPWLVACRKAGKYLDDPTSFKKESK